jgi:Xaa-Pro aminopeptidase
MRQVSAESEAVLGTGGGGGWGNPFEREPLFVLDDVKAGIVSVAAAERDYGVAIASETLTVDERRTAAIRRGEGTASAAAPSTGNRAKQNDRRTAAREWLSEQGLDGLLAFNDGQNSFLESNAVYVLSGVRPLGESAVVVARDGGATLIVTPEWDGERVTAAADTEKVIATGDIADALAAELSRLHLDARKLAVVGLSKQRRALVRKVTAALHHAPQQADTLAAHLARVRSPDELAAMRRAVSIGEQGYRHLKDVVRPGMREFELAASLYTFMKGLGAEDNFLLMSASQHNLAVRAAGRRVLEVGDIILAEITPCYRGQFAQLCRTVVLGETSALQHDKYAILQLAMRRGMEAAVPGSTVAEATEAINGCLRDAGYGEYCRPPFMRVRGHGLGITSNAPGDLHDKGDVRFEEGMVFVMHPNQYIPETGYLMCGETVVISHNGAISLSDNDAVLDTVST